MSNRPFTYSLISNLALAEIVLTISYPFIFHYTSEPWSWVFGKLMCKLVNPLVVCSTLVITFTLAVIALYRCLILIQPQKQRPTKRSAYVVILFSWIWGVALSMPASITRTITEIEVCGPKILLLCCENFPNNEMKHNYSIALFVLQFVVPFLVMVCSYGIVIFKVKKHIWRTKKEVHGPDDDDNGLPTSIQMSKHRKSGETSSNATENGNRRESSRIQHLESDVLKMIYVIILVFFLCYLPSHIVFISEELEWFLWEDWKCNIILQRYTYILHALPSALHPICYGSMSKMLAVKSRCFIYNCPT